MGTVCLPRMVQTRAGSSRGSPTKDADATVGKGAPQKLRTASDVFLYIPNLIGYARVFGAIAAFAIIEFCPERWALAILLYISSFVGDLFDGIAARRLNQCSLLGAVLDMVTDRCATAGLVIILGWSEFFPQYRLVWLMCVVLDFSSHWCAMYCAARFGLHHKSADANKDKFFLMRWYYDIYPFFGYCCVGQEFFYILLFVIAPSHDLGEHRQLLEFACWYLCGPAWGMKQIVNWFQLTSSCYSLAERDAEQVNEQAK